MSLQDTSNKAANTRNSAATVPVKKQHQVAREVGESIQTKGCILRKKAKFI